ncbi:MAG: DeoR family transcriptional regulator [Anaerolineales bacterium]|nr:DeoR family transcriptional regulator [Anaerolineales bacterium]
MSYSAIDRENKIIEVLQKKGSASIQELAEILKVSTMTIHRDLNKMEHAGYIQKKHGGVILAGKLTAANKHACAMCNKPVSERTIFIVQFENGEQKRACCAHCGLMIQSQSKGAWQSLTADYLHGHVVSANHAIYIFGSDLNVCCVPSILSFGSRQDADKFQKGFGGSLVTMEAAIHRLHGMMHTH